MIGTPRTKTDAELQWSAIKRAITAKVNFKAQVWREAELNKELDVAWKAFKDSLANDELPEYEPPELGA